MDGIQLVKWHPHFGSYSDTSKFEEVRVQDISYREIISKINVHWRHRLYINQLIYQKYWEGTRKKIQFFLTGSTGSGTLHTEAGPGTQLYRVYVDN